MVEVGASGEAGGLEVLGEPDEEVLSEGFAR
jgi:hypothetical protein